MRKWLVGCLGRLLAKIDSKLGNKLIYLKYQINFVRKTINFNKIGISGVIRNDVKIINPQWIEADNNLLIGDRVTLSTWLQDGQDKSFKGVKLKIGKNCRFGDDSHITASNYIDIGDNLLTGKKVLISDNSHGHISYPELEMPPIKRPVVSKGPVIIGKNVWIGENVAILQNVNIGDCCIIGANSVVTDNIPPFCVACGIPARVIKRLK